MSDLPREPERDGAVEGAVGQPAGRGRSYAGPVIVVTLLVLAIVTVAGLFGPWGGGQLPRGEGSPAAPDTPVAPATPLPDPR